MMTPFTKNLISVVLASLLLGACSLFGKEEKTPEYYEVTESDLLTIPEDLDQPRSNQALNIEHPPIPLPAEAPSTIPPRVVINESRDGDSSIMRWASEGVYILVEESPEALRSRLGGVIQDSGMQLLGEGDDGDYSFVFDDRRPEIQRDFWDKVTFWNNDIPDYSGSYLTLAQPDGGKTRIYLKYADGGEVPIEAAEYVLAIIKGNLG